MDIDPTLYFKTWKPQENCYSIHDFDIYVACRWYLVSSLRKKWNDVQLALHLSNIYGLPFRKEDQQAEEEVTSFAMK